MERLRGSGQRKEEFHPELKIGRLKQDSVNVPRDVKVLEWANSIFSNTVNRKSMLEVSHSLIWCGGRPFPYMVWRWGFPLYGMDIGHMI